jgi:hypothetical protein
MTQAFNLSQLANNLNTSGQLDATDGLVNAVPVTNGGTGASTASAARTNLSVPSLTGTGASGTWGISISGNAATATSATSATNATNATNATYATTAGNGGVTSVDTITGAVSLASLAAFAKSLTANGYQKLPGGLIIQWGSNSSSSASVTFPIAFPTALLQVIYSFGYPSSQAFAGGYQWLTAQSTTGFTTYYDPANASGKGTWIAIGY